MDLWIQPALPVPWHHRTSNGMRGVSEVDLLGRVYDTGGDEGLAMSTLIGGEATDSQASKLGPRTRRTGSRAAARCFTLAASQAS